MEEYIRTVIAPKLQGDGGWIEFLSEKDGELQVILRGECSKCSVLPSCINWIKGEIKRDLGQDVEIHYIRKKPFFWDTKNG